MQPASGAGRQPSPFQPIRSAKPDAAIPAHFQGTCNPWRDLDGIPTRARVIVYDPLRVKAADVPPTSSWLTQN